MDKFIYIFDKNKDIKLFLKSIFEIKKEDKNFLFGGIISKVSFFLYKYEIDGEEKKAEFLLKEYVFDNGGTRKSVLDICELTEKFDTFFHPYDLIEYNKKEKNIYSLLKEDFNFKDIKLFDIFYLEMIL